jgi:hypothetical protein
MFAEIEIIGWTVGQVVLLAVGHAHIHIQVGFMIRVVQLVGLYP